jgi:N-acetyl-anhydromuramyl-L-alanine amidase AmpD
MDYKAIIIHGPSSACPRTRPGSRDVQAHFIIPPIDATGTVRPEPTARWKEQLAATHTRNTSVNRKSISIWIDAPSGEPAAVQIEALRDLVGRLRAEYGIAADRIYSHAEVDTVSCGAGRIAATLRACPWASRRSLR